MAIAVEDLPVQLGTRAVERLVNAGDVSVCAWCDGDIGFEARKRNRQVIANVYGKRDRRGRLRVVRPGRPGGSWIRTEHWHPECYDQAGHPHGEPDLHIPDYRSGKR